jgi:hypothetical protein
MVINVRHSPYYTEGTIRPIRLMITHAVPILLEFTNTANHDTLMFTSKPRRMLRPGDLTLWEQWRTTIRLAKSVVVAMRQAPYHGE